MKDYYQILRVRRGAGAPEIRRAYRVLVQRLHPDINPDPAAHELIKEVNEAYDVLSDEGKKREYDYRLENPYGAAFAPEEPKHRDPAYKRTTYRHTAPRAPSQRDLMHRYAHVFTKVSWAGTVLFLILMADLLIPHRVTEDVVSTFRNRGSGRYEANYIVTTSGQRIKISASDAYFFEADQPVEIVTSRLLSVLVEIRIPGSDSVINNLSTVYANFRFVLWILGIFSIVGVAVKGYPEFRFNLGVMTFFVLMFTVYLLLK